MQTGIKYIANTFTSWSCPTPSSIVLTSSGAFSSDSITSVTAIDSSTPKNCGGEGDHSIGGDRGCSTINHFTNKPIVKNNQNVKMQRDKNGHSNHGKVIKQVITKYQCIVHTAAMY